MNTTSEFSFVLRPSAHGVGVFATHDIAKDTFLRLFGDGEKIDLRSQERQKNLVPEVFQDYCMDRGQKWGYVR